MHIIDKSIACSNMFVYSRMHAHTRMHTHTGMQLLRIRFDVRAEGIYGSPTKLEPNVVF